MINKSIFKVILLIAFLLFSTALFVPPVSAYTTHAPISIDGNSQFTAENGVVSGSGSATDPFIIENWKIDASAQDGIRIASTDAHFVIRNCTINGGIESGIYLANVTNGEVEGNTCKNSRRGIWLHASSNNTISNNTCSNMLDEGIYVFSSNNNSLTQNTCFNNQYYGIRVERSSYTFLTYNNCSYNNDGIRCGYGTYDTLMCNTIAYNLRYGVWCGGPHTMIINCSIYNNGDYGVSNDLDPANVANATNCWWGSPSGPGGVGPGTGDAITANVLYDPWLTEPAVVKQNATLAINSNATSVVAGSAVIISGSLSPAQNGTVTIYRSFNNSIPQSIVATLSNGAYQYQSLLNDRGTYQFYAYWSGNDNYNPATSSTITVTASAAPLPAPGINPLWYVVIGAVVVVVIIAVAYFLRKK